MKARVWAITAVVLVAALAALATTGVLRIERVTTPRSRVPARTPTPQAPTTSPTASAAAPRPTPAVGDGDPFLSAQVIQYLGARQGTITAAICDQSTQTTYVYNPGQAEAEASIAKVDILSTALYEAQERGSSLPDYERELAVPMIEESDDTAANSLWADIGGSGPMGAYNAKLGLTGTKLNTIGYWGLTTTTAADQLRLLNGLVRTGSPLSAESQAYLLGLMESVDPSQAWGVPTGVPSGATVAVKNGWLPLGYPDWQINSLGVVSWPGHQYTIAVLTTNNPSEGYGIETIDGLAALIWNFLEPPPPSPGPELRP